MESIKDEQKSRCMNGTEETKIIYEGWNIDQLRNMHNNKFLSGWEGIEKVICTSINMFKL
jgi:hypothetical protein